MRTVLLFVLLASLTACRPTRSLADDDALNVRVELARTEEGYQPPVFRWDAPIAARLTVSRASFVVWEVAKDDMQGPDGRARRGPLTPPVAYGMSFAENEMDANPRTLVAPTSLQPGVFYTVTVVGYDGAKSTASFSVHVPFSF